MSELKHPELSEAERKALHEKITFTVTCTMKVRWARQFLAMLRRMQQLGSWGSSRNVTLFADGDGDFRPKFEWSDVGPLTLAEPVSDQGGDAVFDAG